MRKKRFFILIVMFAVTGIVTMSGCSRNQDALTWLEVTSNIKDTLLFEKRISSIYYLVSKKYQGYNNEGKNYNQEEK